MTMYKLPTKALTYFIFPKENITAMPIIYTQCLIMKIYFLTLNMYLWIIPIDITSKKNYQLTLTFLTLEQSITKITINS